MLLVSNLCFSSGDSYQRREKTCVCSCGLSRRVFWWRLIGGSRLVILRVIFGDVSLVRHFSEQKRKKNNDLRCFIWFQSVSGAGARVRGPRRVLLVRPTPCTYNSVSASRVTLISSKSKVYQLRDRDHVGPPAGRSVIVEMDRSDWSCEIRYQNFDTRSDTEFKKLEISVRESRIPRLAGCADRPFSGPS